MSPIQKRFPKKMRRIIASSLGRLCSVCLLTFLVGCQTPEYAPSQTVKTAFTATAPTTAVKAKEIVAPTEPQQTDTLAPTPTDTRIPTNTLAPTETSAPENTLTPAQAEMLATATNEPAPTVALTDTPAPGNNPATGDIVIQDIFYDGSGSKEPDEYVEIQNNGNDPIQLQGWVLSDDQNHRFIFPEFIMQPGQSCRIYTNEKHPESCGFNFGSSKTAIWNNSGDCASLKDNQGTPKSKKCY